VDDPGSTVHADNSWVPLICGVLAWRSLYSFDDQLVIRSITTPPLWLHHAATPDLQTSAANRSALKTAGIVFDTPALAMPWKPFSAGRPAVPRTVPSGPGSTR